VTSGPLANGSATGVAPTTHLSGAEAPTTALDGNGTYWDASILERPDNTAGGDLWNPPDSEACCGGQYAVAQTQAPTTALDGNGTYWDASILERPDNTAGGDLWNPPDSESCCGGQYAVAQTQLATVAPAAPFKNKSGSETKPVRPSPAHMLMCGHALTLGAIHALPATMEGKNFMHEWKSEATAAANAMTPIGGFMYPAHSFA